MDLLLRWELVLLIAESTKANTMVSANAEEAAGTVAKRFEENLLVPDVIATAPVDLVQVEYPSGVKVNLGGELTPTQVKNAPSICWPADPDTYYTLVLTDPDAPSRIEPTSREWHHWLVGNILRDCDGNLGSGETFSAFVGAAPQLDTGLHRYVFLVYKQPGKLNFDEPRLNNTSVENRANFRIAKFAAKYNLKDPIAGNFFQAQYDDYVPILNKQLGL